jgi:hypothetical protein
VPRYHFHWALGTYHVNDSDGVELPIDDAARQRAVAERELLVASISGERLSTADTRIEVCDPSGRTLFCIPCADLARS